MKLGKMGDFSDLNTDNVKERTCKYIVEYGFDAWYQDYVRRADLLTIALERYNNGRMKRWLCELFIRQELETLEKIMRQAETLSGSPKELGKAFQEIAGRVCAPTGGE